MTHSAEPAPAIRVRGLRKSYGSFEALGGLDFEVGRGEIFALLGPNGAGKTTTVEILEGYRDYDAGTVEVLGVDPARPSRRWRDRIGIVPERDVPAAADSTWRDHIGIVLQSCQVEPELSVRESLEMFAGYFSRPRPVSEVLELVGMTGEADRRSGKLSGGQQRRLDVALGLVGNPELLFLDEPTTGFDPAARRQFWDVIAGLRDVGTTVLLTTHYMEEAEHLADRVAVVVRGRIVAEGAPAELGGRDRGRTRIAFRLPAGLSAADLPADLGCDVELEGGCVLLRTDSPWPLLERLAFWSRSRGVELEELEVVHPSLEEVYLDLTAEAAE